MFRSTSSEGRVKDSSGGKVKVKNHKTQLMEQPFTVTEYIS